MCIVFSDYELIGESCDGLRHTSGSVAPGRVPILALRYRKARTTRRLKNKNALCSSPGLKPNVDLGSELSCPYTTSILTIADAYALHADYAPRPSLPSLSSATFQKNPGDKLMFAVAPQGWYRYVWSSTQEVLQRY